MTSLQKASLEEIREAAARLCKDYLTGRWKEVKTEDLIVKRISGGLSNFLYYVSLPEVEASNSNNNNNINNNNVNDDSGVIAHETSCSSLLDISITDSTNSNSEPANLLLNRTKKRQRTDSGGSNASSASMRHKCIAEPQQVLLRIYGQTHEDGLESMITESVVFALLSERNLGPKLHGIFPGGRIEQFIPARPLLTLELSDAKISMKIAQKMGEIHGMDIPMSKEPDWLFNSIQRWLHSVKNLLKNRDRFKNINAAYLEKVCNFDFAEECQWLKTIIAANEFPVLFCHNDLQEGNILLKEDNCQSPKRRCISSSSPRSSSHFDDSVSNMSVDDVNDVVNGLQKKPFRNVGHEIDTENTCDSAWSSDFIEDNSPNLIIIDFEYCAYNFRGFDLANHFLEWTFDYTNPNFPYFHHHKHQYPNENQRRNFIAAYLSKLNEDIEDYEPTSEEIDDVEQEVRVFSMFSHIFWSLWSIVNVTSNIQFGYWEYAMARIREYELLKQQFLADLKFNEKMKRVHSLKEE